MQKNPNGFYVKMSKNSVPLELFPPYLELFTCMFHNSS